MMELPAQSVTATPYDPETEADPLIREHITLNPETGEAVFRAYDYPVWAIVLNLQATNYARDRVQRMFSELPKEAIEAAERFWRLHPDDIRPFFEERSA